MRVVASGRDCWRLLVNLCFSEKRLNFVYVHLFSSTSSSNESANSNEGLNTDPTHMQRQFSSQLTPSSSVSIPSKFEQQQRVLDDDPDFDTEVELPPLEAFIPKEVLRKLKPKEKERQKVINGSLLLLSQHIMLSGNSNSSAIL